MSNHEIISVKHASKTFKLPHEKYTGIKQALINFRPGHKTYEVQEVLRDISFTVNAGEFVGIVGRNGSGKSTLLKLLANIYRPSSGAIHVVGRLVPFIELGVGFNPELTGRDNVYLNSALLGFSRTETDEMYRSIVDFAELEPFMDQKLKNYSSGMQVRLAFSIAIRAQSDILLIDEVLAVGDVNFQQKCFDYFEKLKRTKQTVVFVSHDMGAVNRFCTRAIYIKSGKLVLDGTPADAADLYAESNMSVDKTEQWENSGRHNLKTAIAEQSARHLTLSIAYETEDPNGAYVGLSLVRDGILLAEISTPFEKPLVGKGTVTYTLNKTLFNPGMYQLAGVSLFRLANRELIARSGSRNEFVVTGNDPTRSGALKLEDKWDYGKS